MFDVWMAVLWKEQNVDEIWACALIQQRCLSTLGSDVESHEIEDSIDRFVEEREDCQAVLETVHIRFVELLILQISLLCRRYLHDQGILR